MSNAIVIQPPLAQNVERVLIDGDLSALTAAERVSYYNRLCQSMGLNPLTKPFDYIKLSGKLTLYAKRDCTDQLRKIYSISISIVQRLREDDLITVVARATTPDGRTDEAIGSVPVLGKKGEDLSNAMMKAETKAKRRVTLSICSLGYLDESEVGSIKGAQPVDLPEMQADVVDLAALQAKASEQVAEVKAMIATAQSRQELDDGAYKALLRLLNNKAKLGLTAEQVKELKEAHTAKWAELGASHGNTQS